MNAGQQPPARPMASAAAPMPPQQQPPPMPPPVLSRQADPVLGAPHPDPRRVVAPVRPVSQIQTRPVSGGGVVGHVTSTVAAATVEVTRPGLATGIPVSRPSGPGGPGPAGGGLAAVREHREWRVRRHRAIARLRIGRHQASDEALDRLQLAGSSFGLGLGRDQAGQPMTIAMFRPEPVAVTLIGGLWAAKFIAFRALRFGARVTVVTNHPVGWTELGRVATGRTDRVAVLAPGTSAGLRASADAPVLRLYETGEPSAEEAAWQTGLTVLRRLTPDRVAAVPHADLVLMQRLTPHEAGIVASARRLTPRTSQQLQMLRDDMMAVVADTGSQYVWVSPAGAERDRLGRPGRY